MRRKRQQIDDIAELEEIIREAAVCRLALIDGGSPYIVPLSFGYRDNALYFHSAGEGRKMDLLRSHPEVCFELESRVEILKGKTACSWGVSYRSIVGYGRAVFVAGAGGKQRALDIIMAHYSDDKFDYSKKDLDRTTVFKVVISSMTGKRSAN